jgi:hypothetical protein
MKNIGIWTRDLSFANMVKLREQGFNSLFLNNEWFWDLLTENKKKESDWTIEKAVEAVNYWYNGAKGMGYKFFLIDVAWGMWPLDGNDLWYKLYEKFKDCTDVAFFFDEPHEALVETGKYTKEEIRGVLLERAKVIGDRLMIGGTKRNSSERYVNVVTQYNCQEGYWSSGTGFVWIYGQLAWHFFSSLRYKKLSKVADSLNISGRFLYQYDVDEFSIKQPGTWLNGILKIIGIRNWFENWQRERFVKYFGEK